MSYVIYLSNTYDFWVVASYRGGLSLGLELDLWLELFRFQHHARHYHVTITVIAVGVGNQSSPVLFS